MLDCDFDSVESDQEKRTPVRLRSGQAPITEAIQEATKAILRDLFFFFMILVVAVLNYGANGN